MKGINVIFADSLKKWNTDAEIDGKWVLARPLGLDGFFYRLSKAWQVFTGKADVLTWYKQ